MKVLITGITGFAGSHLAELAAAKKGTEVYGLHRESSFLNNLEGVKDRVRLERCDLLDPAGVIGCFKKVKPDRVVHLAGQTYSAESYDAPAKTLNDNILGGLHVLEAVRAAAPKARVLVVGSCEEYGETASPAPIHETAALKPLSPYGVSKAALSFLAYQYFKNFKIPVVRSRAFNHTGPRQKDLFVASGFGKQVARIEAGKQAPVIHVGNLEARRDFTDVRDVVRAYWMLLERGRPGEVYNVCSGHGVQIRRILEIYLEKSKVKIKIQKDPERVRRNEAAGWIGDPRLLEKTISWKPTIALEKTLSDVLDYWRKRV